jgi:hypothetical protein
MGMMGQLSIRHALEEKVREIGGDVKGAGCLMVPPYTMDFNFELDGRNYSVKLVDIEELKKARDNPPSDDCGIVDGEEIIVDEIPSKCDEVKKEEIQDKNN